MLYDNLIDILCSLESAAHVKDFFTLRLFSCWFFFNFKCSENHATLHAPIVNMLRYQAMHGL